MRSSKTCVITVNYRGAADTAACVRSLLASSVSMKIVVVDTTPNDPDLASALEFAPEVILIRADKNVGFGSGNNLGIEWALAHADCDYFFLFNNDATVQHDSIEILETAASVQVNAGILVPRIAYRDRPQALWYGGGEIDWRRASAYTPGMNQSVDAPLATTERDITFATGCALFVRREVLELIGGFDPRYFMYEEDVEFSLRARKYGFGIRYLPESLVFHRVQGSSRVDEEGRYSFWSTASPMLPFYAFHVIRNRLLTAYLHARGKDMLTVMLYFPLYIVRRAILFLLGGRPDAVAAMIRGAFDAVSATQESLSGLRGIQKDGTA